MSVTFPNGQETEARLVSPLVNVSSTSCFSFFIYYNTSFASVTVGTVKAVSYQKLNYTTTRVLQYPFSSALNSTNLTSGFNTIQLAIQSGSYHVAIVAGSSEGSIWLGNISHEHRPCSNSRK